MICFWECFHSSNLWRCYLCIWHHSKLLIGQLGYHITSGYLVPIDLTPSSSAVPNRKLNNPPKGRRDLLFLISLGLWIWPIKLEASIWVEVISFKTASRSFIVMFNICVTGGWTGTLVELVGSHTRLVIYLALAICCWRVVIHALLDTGFNGMQVVTYPANVKQLNHTD